MLRPVKELKAFQKLDLASGEEKTATFTVSVDDLKFYDEKIQDWKAEPGKFKVYAGASSTDIRQTATFEMQYNR